MFIISGSLIPRISTDLSLTEQSYHLMLNACAGHEDPGMCQEYMETSWPDMATCLYYDWVLGDLACYQYGGCQRSSQEWTCSAAGALMGQALADAPYTTYGVEKLLHGPCYCQDNATCQARVSDLLPTVLPVFSAWVGQETQTICGDGVIGEDTCIACRQRMSGITR